MDPTVRAAEAARLRARAGELRRLATDIEGMGVMRLGGLAGPSTWRGPGPELCERVLGVNQQQLRLAVEELRRRSSLLEHHAHEVESGALAAGLHLPR